MKNTRPLFSALAIATVALAQVTARADTAGNIINYASGAAATWDDNGSGNYPVITAILSAPHGTVYNPGATLDGYTYGNWSFLAQDPTHSLDVFYSSSAAGPAANYGTPHVGDTILVQGVYSPFSGIAELANGSAQAINVFGPGTSGNAPYYPTPTLTTIPTVNVGTNGHGVSASGLSGELLQVNNVTIGGYLYPNFPFHNNSGTATNGNWTITDGANNSMTLFYWASSYSVDGAMAGQPIPTGLVDVTGFISDFYSTVTSSITPEFVPVSFTAVPEPSAMDLCGIGSALAWVCYRFRRKA